MTEVTFKDFQSLMTKRNTTVDDLVDLFHGKLDENRPFFERVMSCRTRDREDLSRVVIPYRQVLKFYFQEKSSQDSLEQAKKTRNAA